MTYAYVCESCGHTFELMLLMESRNEPCDQACPNCGDSSVTRDIRAEGFVFTMDPVKLGFKKPDREFRNLMGKIKKDTGGSGNIDKHAL